MTEIGLLKRAGAIAFTNGKSSVANTRVMRNVLLYAKDFDALIVHHTEDPYLADGGAMNSGEVVDAARPAGHAQGRRDDRARARRAPRRDDRRALSRRHHLLRREPRRDPRRQGAQAARHLRRLDQSPDAERERHRPLPHLLQAAPAAARRGRPRGHGARRWPPATSTSSSPATIRRTPTPSAARSRKPPTAPSASRRCWRPRCASYHTGEIGLLPLLRAMTINPAQAAGPASGRLDEGRARRPHPGRSRRALGRRQGPAALALQELAVRREQDAGPRAAHHGCRRHRLPIRWRRTRLRLHEHTEPSAMGLVPWRRADLSSAWGSRTAMDVFFNTTRWPLSRSAICSARSRSACC